MDTLNKTRVEAASAEAISAAADLLRRGEVVAFPTETVYGLGANATDEMAVGKIFAAKGRPSNNPLIVHVADIEQAKRLVKYWPEDAETLARALWPGPVTFVLPKAECVPAITTAGGETVGIRMPAHPVALQLIEACGFPLAAPSANRSNYISPTMAQHVLRSLGGRIPMVLDGGPCEGGIESTVLDLSGDECRILRPGLFSANFLSALLGKKVADAGNRRDNDIPLLSPGQLLTHYSPTTPLLLGHIDRILTEWETISGPDLPKKIALMIFEDTIVPEKMSSSAVIERMPRNNEHYAQKLFATLHHLDSQNLKAIFCEAPPADAEWSGINDRLSRAGKLL